MLCACNFNCDINYCTSKFGCFTQIVLKSDQKRYSILYGCTSNLIQSIQCGLDNFKDQFKCCKSGDFCNLNFTNEYLQAPKLPRDTTIQFWNINYFLIILSCLFSILISGLALYFCKKIRQIRRESHIKDQLKNFRHRIQHEINEPKIVVETIQSYTSSGNGPSELIQRTISRDIHIDYDSGPLGKGRFGVVWKAKWNHDDIAVKVFFSMNEPSWTRETQIYQTNLIRHENILGYITSDIMGLGCTVNMIILTDYHPLGSLYDYLQKNTLNKSQLLKFLFSISNGLTHLHQEIFSTSYKPSIIHRDLKTKNILVKQNLECCIADFGLAIRFNHNHIENDYELSLRQGSVRYMAPECLNESLDLRSVESLKKTDIYSFSLVIWEVISRLKIDGFINDEHRPPFYEMVSGDPQIDVMRDIVCVKGLRPKSKIENLIKDQDLIQVVELMRECWSNNPAERLSALYLKKKFKKFIQ
ncbi:unnamed protein product [Brachionus calyciflorus]|uniref:Serine/threonine-protein kinase receptor n=1 Tax=Brachionus calyciflorus TaxID=104777 RepID=A0A814BXE5_9BILA|nr:unnamed protein product [Brachionus calyciflorus]